MTRALQDLAFSEYLLTLQQVIDQCVSLNSLFYFCYLDASKAFDRINHWFIGRSFPLLVLRIIFFLVYATNVY